MYLPNIPTHTQVVGGIAITNIVTRDRVSGVPIGCGKGHIQTIIGKDGGGTVRSRNGHTSFRCGRTGKGQCNFMPHHQFSCQNSINPRFGGGNIGHHRFDGTHFHRGRRGGRDGYGYIFDGGKRHGQTEWIFIELTTFPRFFVRIIGGKKWCFTRTGGHGVFTGYGE